MSLHFSYPLPLSLGPLAEVHTHTHAQVPIKVFSTYPEPSILIHRMGNEIRKSSLRSMTGENTKALELSWT